MSEKNQVKKNDNPKFFFLIIILWNIIFLMNLCSLNFNLKQFGIKNPKYGNVIVVVNKAPQFWT
jgi:hypothetical protein